MLDFGVQIYAYGEVQLDHGLTHRKDCRETNKTRLRWLPSEVTCAHTSGSKEVMREFYFA